jgi:hypothetical protein
MPGESTKGELVIRPPMIYRALTNEDELRALWDFDHLAYGEAGLPWEIFLDWWKAFPEGLHGVFAGDLIVGAVGMWPLTSAVHGAMLRGSLAESDLRPADFDLVSEMKRHWYISGIVLREEWRRTGPIGALIFTAVERLGDLANLERVDVCAIGSTKEGRRMLDRFGFSPRGTSTTDGQPVYVSSDLVLDLALGDRSAPPTSPAFQYSPPIRRKFPSSAELADLDDLRVVV